MKENRLEMANGLQKNIKAKRSNLKDAATLIATMDKIPTVYIRGQAGGYNCPNFQLPARLAKNVLGIMHLLLLQDLKAAEEVFKRL